MNVIQKIENEMTGVNFTINGVPHSHRWNGYNSVELVVVPASQVEAEAKARVDATKQVNRAVEISPLVWLVENSNDFYGWRQSFVVVTSLSFSEGEFDEEGWAGWQVGHCSIVEIEHVNGTAYAIQTDPPFKGMVSGGIYGSQGRIS